MKTIEEAMKIIRGSKQYKFKGTTLIITGYYTGEELRLNLGELTQEMLDELQPYDENETLMEKKAMNTYYCVSMTIYDNGGSECHISTVEAETKPESEFKSTSRIDIYKDYFNTKEEAEEFINEEYD